MTMEAPNAFRIQFKKFQIVSFFFVLNVGCSQTKGA